MTGLPARRQRNKASRAFGSGAHADTLIRTLSPRFKDRALLVERGALERFGASMLDLARAHVDQKMIAWVPRSRRV
jgi:hypothetical protein